MNKRLITVLFFVLLALSVSALNINTYLGILSGVGVELERNQWIFDLDFETSFPVNGFIDSIIGPKFSDVSKQEAFLLGSDYFYGLNVSAFRNFYSIKSGSFYLGLSTILGVEKPIKMFDMVFRPEIKYSYQINDKIDVYTVVGTSFLYLSYLDGYTKPLIEIPDQNIYSVLTGCRLGLSINLEQKYAQQ